MPLFRRSLEPQPDPVLTVNGSRQPVPERPGTAQRRFRLFVECERRLADDPLATRRAVGRPLGDGQGLEGLVATIAPLFAREPSLIRWVALRGALAELFIRVLDPDSAVVSPAELERAMGLEWVAAADGTSDPDVALPWRSKLPPPDREAALGIAGSVLVRADDYPRFSAMSVQEVNADANCRRMGAALALDTIAWTAIALLRLQIAPQLFSQVPEPDQLREPGWYTEPLFAKAERYWDGSDWTDRCRVPSGRSYTETSVPLR